MLSEVGHDDQLPLTPAEVANLARIKRRTVYRLIDRGQLPAAKVGGQWRIPVMACRALLTPTVVEQIWRRSTHQPEESPDA